MFKRDPYARGINAVIFGAGVVTIAGVVVWTHVMLADLERASESYAGLIGDMKERVDSGHQ